jgi:hypothetical protein
MAALLKYISDKEAEKYDLVSGFCDDKQPQVPQETFLLMNK